MPRNATKAADNVFYLARKAAEKCNDHLGSREGAAEETGIDRTRLARIEAGVLVPYPEEVLMMAHTYQAPSSAIITAPASIRWAKRQSRPASCSRLTAWHSRSCRPCRGPAAYSRLFWRLPVTTRLPRTRSSSWNR